MSKRTQEHQDIPRRRDSAEETPTASLNSGAPASQPVRDLDSEIDKRLSEDSEAWVKNNRQKNGE